MVRIKAMTTDFGDKALHEAAWCGQEAVVRLLLEKGADPEAKNSNKWTALHVAAVNGHDAMVRLLLEKGVDVKAKDKFGGAALTRRFKAGTSL